MMTPILTLLTTGDRRLTTDDRCQLNVGNFTKSSRGTASTGCPALRHAARPPTRMNALKPFSRSRSATRALVASRCQVQYR
jgi:hypothetical protein